MLQLGLLSLFSAYAILTFMNLSQVFVFVDTILFFLFPFQKKKNVMTPPFLLLCDTFLADKVHKNTKIKMI